LSAGSAARKQQCGCARKKFSAIDFQCLISSSSLLRHHTTPFRAAGTLCRMRQICPVPRPCDFSYRKGGKPQPSTRPVHQDLT
jgi:hypothetical protein